MAGRDTSASAGGVLIRNSFGGTAPRPGRTGSLGERPRRHSLTADGPVPPNASLHADVRTTRKRSNRQKLLTAAYPSVDQAGYAAVSSFCRLLRFRVVRTSACSDAFGGTGPSAVRLCRRGLSPRLPVRPGRGAVPPNEFLISTPPADADVSLPAISTH